MNAENCEAEHAIELRLRHPMGGIAILHLGGELILLTGVPLAPQGDEAADQLAPLNFGQG